MEFSGQANAKDLAQVFHLVASTGRPGTLTVSSDGEGGRRLCFYFSPRGVTLLSDRGVRSDELAAELVADGLVTPDEAKAALAEQERTGGYLGEILHRQGAVPVEAVPGLVHRQIQQEILALCTWERGTFEFVEGDLNPEVRDRYRFATSFAFDPQHLLMEAARRLDEWHRVVSHVPDENAILVRTEEAGGERKGSPVATAVALLADGTRTVGEIVRTSRFSRFDVLRSLAQLVKAGRLREASVEEVLASARSLARQGEHLRAARLYQHLARRRPDDAVMPLKAGQFYERSGCTGEAQAAYRMAVERLLAGGMLSQALGVIDVMKTLDPNDRYALETSVRLRLGGRGAPPGEGAPGGASGEASSAEEGERREGLADARRLVVLLADAGELAQAVEYARLVTAGEPDDLPARRVLVDLLKRAGRRREAADELVQLAELLKAANPASPGSRFRRLLREAEALDPGRPEVRKALQALEATPPAHLRFRERRRSWGRLALVSAALGLVLAAGTFAVVYEVEGRQAFREVRRNAANLLERHRYQEAARLYAEVARAFRYSSVADDAELARRDVLARGRRYTTGRLRGGRRALEAAWAGALEAARSGVALVAERARESADQADALLAAASLYCEARRLEGQAKYAEARSAYARLIRSWPELATYLNVELPLEVQSLPLGARVFVNGREVGRTPLLVRHPPFAAYRIVIRQPGFEPYEATLEATPGADLGAELPRRPVWTFSTGGAIESAPAWDGKRVFFGSRDGHVYAVGARTGRLVWKFDTGTLGDVTCSPAAAGGAIFAGSHDHYVYALDSLTGRQRWRFRTGRLIRGSPCVVERFGLLCVGSYDHFVYGLDVASGRQRWRFRTGGPIAASPVSWNGLVLVGSLDRRLYALEAEDGALRWRFEAGGGIRGTPAVAAGNVYFGADDGYLYALDAADGTVRWSFKTGGPVEGSPRVAGGVVYVGSSDGVLYAVDADRGLLRWKYRTGGSIRGAPAVKGRYLYVGSGDGALHVVEVATGEVVWKARTGGPVSAAPVLGDGLVFVGSKDGSLYAFRLPEEEPAGGDAAGGAETRAEEGAAFGERPPQAAGYRRDASERNGEG